MKKGSQIKLVLAFSSLIIFIFIVIGLLKFGQIFAFLLVFKYLTNSLALNLGVNVWTAKIISVFLSIVVVYALFSLFSFKKKKQKKGLILFIGSFVVFSLFMSIRTNDYNFDDQGHPIKYVAMTPSGYQIVPKNWKYHRIYGTKVRKLNPEIIEQMEYDQKNNSNTIKRVIPTINTKFFSNFGNPIIWYFEWENGDLEFFDHGGCHPQLGMLYPLSPVDAEIVKKTFNYLKKDKTKIIGSQKNLVDNTEFSGLLDLSKMKKIKIRR